MLYNSKLKNYISNRTGARYEDLYVKATRVYDEAIQKKATIYFDLLNFENDQEYVVDTFQLSIDEFTTDAMIEVTTGGVTEIIKLNTHLNGGGVYVEADMVTFGMPKYNKLSQIFKANFSEIDFKTGVTDEQFNKDWLKNTVILDGLLLKERFELEVL